MLLNAGVDAVLPVGEFFHSFLAQSVRAPASMQLFSALVLLWSASNLYVQITRRVEEAWRPFGTRMSSFRERRIGMLAAGGMVVLVGAVVLASMVVSVVPHVLGLLIPGFNNLLGVVLAPLLPRLLQPLLIWVLLFGLYMLAPNVKVWPVAAAGPRGLLRSSGHWCIGVSGGGSTVTWPITNISMAHWPPSSP